MKFSTQEEFGLRCLVQLGLLKPDESMTIPEISQKEGLSCYNVAKILRLLRQSGFIKSTRGQSGGYQLSRTPGEIMIHDVLAALGGKLVGPAFCKRHRGVEMSCIHSGECSLRPLWNAVQGLLDSLLTHVSLDDLLCSRQEMSNRMTHHVHAMTQRLQVLHE